MSHNYVCNSTNRTMNTHVWNKQQSDPTNYPGTKCKVQSEPMWYERLDARPTYVQAQLYWYRYYLPVPVRTTYYSSRAGFDPYQQHPPLYHEIAPTGTYLQEHTESRVEC